MINITTNAAELNNAIAQYRHWSGKSLDEVIQKHSGKLAWYLRERLNDVKPSAERMRERLLNRLKTGQGLHIRDKAFAAAGLATDVESRKQTFKAGKKRYTTKTYKGKRLNARNIAVQREIGMRIKAIGFTKMTARFPRDVKQPQIVRNKFGKYLSEAGVRFGKSPRYVKFIWRGEGGLQAENAADSINSKTATRALSLSIRDATANIMEYVKRKQSEAAGKAGMRLR